MWFIIYEDLFLLGIMSFVIYISIGIEKRHKCLKSLGSPLITLLTAGFLGKIGIVPSQHMLYSQIFTWGMPLSLVTTLMVVEPFENKRLLKITIRALVLGVIIFLIGGLFVTLLLYSIGIPEYPDASQSEKLEILYILIAPKILSQAPREGYSLFAVLSNALLPWILLSGLTLPILVKRLYPSVWLNVSVDDARLYSMDTDKLVYLQDSQCSLEKVTLSFSLSLFCLTLCGVISRRYPEIPFLLLLGLSAFLLGKLIPRKRLLNTAKLISNFTVHLLFFAGGTLLIDPEFLQLTAPLSMLIVPLFGFQILATLILGKFMHIDIETITILFQALTAGPYAAHAVAVAKKWQPLYWVAFISGLVIYGLLGLVRLFLI